MAQLKYVAPPNRRTRARWPLILALGLGLAGPAIFAVGPDGTYWPLRDHEYIPVLAVAVFGLPSPPFLIVYVLPQYLLYVVPIFVFLRRLSRRRAANHGA